MAQKQIADADTTAASSNTKLLVRHAYWGLPLLGALTGVFYSVLGNKLHDRLKDRARNRLNKPEDFFKNHDLSKAVGYAVEMMLLDAADPRPGDALPKPTDPEVRAWLRDRARLAPLAWAECLEHGFQSRCPQWSKVLERSLFSFIEDRQQPALSRELWTAFLKRIDGWQKSLIDTRVIDTWAICDRLAARFGEAVWEVIKNDAAGDGYAAEAMHLVISAELLRRAKATEQSTEQLKDAFKKMWTEWDANFKAVERRLLDLGCGLAATKAIVIDVQRSVQHISQLCGVYLPEISTNVKALHVKVDAMQQAMQGGANTADAALAAERTLRATLDAQLREQRALNASLTQELQQAKTALAQATTASADNAGVYMAAAIREAARLLAQGQELASRRTAAMAARDYAKAASLHANLLASRVAFRERVSNPTEAERTQWEHEDADDAFTAGLIAYSQQDWSTAEAAWKRVLAIRPDHADTLFCYGNLLTQLPNRANEAEEKYQGVLRIRPDDATTLYNYGTLLVKLSGRAADAEEKFRAALRIRSDDANTLTNYGSLLADLPGRAAEAEEKFQAALRIRPDDTVTLNNYGNLLKNLRGRAMDAEEKYQAALRIRPDYTVTLNNYGLLLMKLPGRAIDAEEKYQAALRIRPDEVVTLCNYATFLSNLPGRAADAEKKYQAALCIRPDDAVTLRSYGDLLSNLPGRAAEAEEKYQAALRIRPDYAVALYNYGNLLANLSGRAAEAEKKYQAALRVRPDDADTLNNYAVLLWQELRDYSQAKAMFERAFAADPKHPTIQRAYEAFMLDYQSNQH